MIADGMAERAWKDIHVRHILMYQSSRYLPQLPTYVIERLKKNMGTEQFLGLVNLVANDIIQTMMRRESYGLWGEQGILCISQYG